MVKGALGEAPLLSCNLCGSTVKTPLFSTKSSQQSATDPVRCCVCGLVYRPGAPAAPQTLEAYRNQHFADLSAHWTAGRLRVFTPYLDVLDAYRQHGHILDIGAGHGFFLSHCARRGWTCHGIEPSVESAGYAATHFGLHYEHPTLEKTTYKDGYFDVITCWNALDQLPDPKATLQHIHRLLRPGGLVLVRCPNADFHITARRAFNALGSISHRLKDLDQTVFHLYSFDRRTLKALLTATDFIDIRIQGADLGWTTTHQAEAGSLKKIILRLIGLCSDTLFTLTARRVLLNPSLLATGHKPQG